MSDQLPAFLSEVPLKPAFNPVRQAMDAAAGQPEVLNALRLFSSMPPSTGVFANPVRHHHEVQCVNAAIGLDIRSFNIRGRLFEENIVAGEVDAIDVIFVGLFGRDPNAGESAQFRSLLARSFTRAFANPARKAAAFLKTFPEASPDIVMQHSAALRKAAGGPGSINTARPADVLLKEMIDVHLENVAVAACASYMRDLLSKDTRITEAQLVERCTAFAKTSIEDPFQQLFHLLLRRRANAAETRILGQLGAIQVHHGSAGSNMVARYFGTLHTRSISDLFTAAQMALDCGRHFGAISDMTDFVRELESTPPAQRDDDIRKRILRGNLPTFGHPEIAAAGRENRLEMDPRPALYLNPLFDAIDNGTVVVSAEVEKRVAMVERIYQIALGEGVTKTDSPGRLRLTPNTDFGAWLVQEVLGIEEADRTLLSYAYRGFGWMMDVREQLQQPIIRPVIPPDPAIASAHSASHLIPEVISSVHDRLLAGGAFRTRKV